MLYAKKTPDFFHSSLISFLKKRGNVCQINKKKHRRFLLFNNFMNFHIL